jgi:ABC-type polysaccharide/polyol phosphate export permease
MSHKIIRQAIPDRQTGFNEMIDGIKNINVAFYFAWSDTKAKYRRSVLGPLWQVMTTAISVLGLGIIWSEILKLNKSEFIPSLAIGLVFWSFISGSIIDAPLLYVQQRDILKNVPISLFTIVFQCLLKQLVNLAHAMLIVMVILLCYPPHNGFVWMWSLLGFVIVTINLTWIIQIVALFGARFRDVSPLVSAVMPLVFFLTPVLYKANQLSSAKLLMNFNPLYHMITVVRDPLLYDVVPFTSFYICGAMVVVGFFANLYFINKKRYRLTYWI